MTDFTAGMEEAMLRAIEKQQPVDGALFRREELMIKRAFLDGVAHGIEIAHREFRGLGPPTWTGPMERT